MSEAGEFVATITIETPVGSDPLTPFLPHQPLLLRHARPYLFLHLLPATATRPPAKPIRPSSPLRSTAKHHLEPNPFEKSFSSGSSESVERRSDLKGSDPKPSLSTPTLSTRPGAAYRDRSFSQNKSHSSPSSVGNNNNQESGSTPKPLLPPLASITSPAGETHPYPWSAALTSSLRSGPLSPAMLAGPQNSHFDPNSFRTGFTPDLSNFKTGLTPLGGGISFPPPSPNTAAFLAAMVNNTSTPSTSAATITPNTLSTLTNAANAASAAPSIDPASAAGPGAGSALSTQPQNFAGRPTDAHNAFDLAFSRSFPHAKAPQQSGSKLKAQVKADSHRNISPEMMQKPLQGANGDANGDQQNAASGLFLLSRAHDEISKRDAGHSATRLYESKPANGKKGGAAGKKGDDKPNGNKRKKANSAEDNIPANANGGGADAGAPISINAPPAKAAKTAKGGKKASNPNAAASAPNNKAAAAGTGKDADANANVNANANANAHVAFDGGPSYKSENGDDDDQHWDSDDDGDGKGERGNMDEKRKNFLERNRQAALKCRQRKKAWLASLQAKVEYLQNDNENLQNTVSALRNENMFLKSQLVQATGGQALPAMPMVMPMAMPMAPHPAGPHAVDPHHSMGPAGMGIPASMAPHPAYMHPQAAGPPVSQGPPGAYASAHVRGPIGPAFSTDHMQQQQQQQQQQRPGQDRPKSEGDGLDPTQQQPHRVTGEAGMRHEREWSSASDVVSKANSASAATIKV